MILAFITATTYLQLGLAVAIYPFVAFFAYRIFIVKEKKTEAVKQVATEIVSQLTCNSDNNVNRQSSDDNKLADAKIADIDKRAFLKIIGATGVSFFLFSLFNRRTDGLFFDKTQYPGISSLIDEAGNKINPSQRQPLDGYVISEIDEGYTAYYGFTDKNGSWYIMSEDPESGSFRYIRGENDFSSNWISRKNLKYDYFHAVFP